MKRTSCRDALRWGMPIAIAALLCLQLSAVRAEEKTEAKDKPAAKKLFDGKTLKGWKSAEFGGEGKVEVNDGAIVMNEGNMMTGVVYAGKDFPKMDYEVTFEGKRVKGGDFFCTTTFPVGDAHCSLVTGGWGGTVVGLSSVDHYDASENETAGFKEFEQNQWYKFRIRVIEDRIETWIDGKRFVNLKTKDRKIGLRFECEPCRPFGFATWCTTGAVRNVEVRQLTAADKKAIAETHDADMD